MVHDILTILKKLLSVAQQLRLVKPKMMKVFMRNGLTSSIIISREWPTGKLCHYNFQKLNSDHVFMDNLIAFRAVLEFDFPYIFSITHLKKF